MITFAGFSLALPTTFFTGSNVLTMLTGELPILILALALTVTLTVNEYDLSVGAAAALSAVVIATLMQHGVNFWVIVIVVAVGGSGLGVVHWMFSTKLGINSFIVTLGTSTLLAGLALFFSNGETVPAPSSFPASALYTQGVGPIPIVVFAVLALALAMGVVLERFPVGRHLRFLGQSGDAARLAGLPVSGLRLGAFVTGAVISSVCGVVVLGQLGSADPGVGSNFLLPAFAAAFLGSTTIQPGRFNVAGTVCGFYLLNIGVTGFTLLGAAAWVQQVFNGGALVGAVAFARIVALRQERRQPKEGLVPD
ncbi:MAG: ABC transporter permease [Candidatus Dormibacteria bacterium]